MEEVREALVHSIVNVPKTTASRTKTGFQHVASTSTTGSPRNLSIPMTFPAISKKPLLNGTVAEASSVKSPDIHSAASLPPFAMTYIEVEIGVNGGAATIEHLNETGHHTVDSTNRSFVQGYSQSGKSLDKKVPAIYPVTGSVGMVYQAPRGELSVQKQSIFFSHKAIVKNIERILQHVNHPNWTVPSAVYMNNRIDCQICKVPIADMESLLVCDACERGMHLKCLQCYGNQGLPTTEWYCPICVAHSKGKPLTPKYGKVRRTMVAPNSDVMHSSLQVAAQNPTKKYSKEVAANGCVLQGSTEVGSDVPKSGTFAFDSSSSESLSTSSVGPQKEDVKRDETSSAEKEGHARFCSEIQSTRATTYGSCNLHSESSSMSSVDDSTLQSTALYGLKHSNHSFIVSSVENCESARTAYQHPSKNVQIASTRAPTDEMHQADGATNNGIGKPYTQELMEDDAISDHGSAQQVTLDGHTCSEQVTGDHEDGYVGCSMASIVDWVGDGLKSVDDKTYYNSCNIDGIVYNLHDHILIASEGTKSCPCKLQSLWEEHDTGSRLAMVNPYFFGSDIPEFISKPCTHEENEVYGSNDERIILVSAICGPCEVLHVDKFREGTKRRYELDNSGSRLHQIFLCRWNYDESSSSFYRDYNVDC